MATHELAVGGIETRSSAHNAEPLADPESVTRLTGHDVAMGWVLAVMVTFGATVGFVFPAAVAPFIDLHAGAVIPFRIACVAAGLCVGAFAYGVARFTLFRANRRLAHLAAYDGLTGLFNQRQFPRALGSELLRAQRNDQPATLIITDLDHFKLINDEYGHTTGDDVLAAVAHDVVASVRPFDIACRIGGEEFTVILPQTGRDEGLEVAERIRARVALTDHESLPSVTISCGVATFPDDANAIRDLTKRADDAMYAAKAAGRNAVRAWQA